MVFFGSGALGAEQLSPQEYMHNWETTSKIEMEISGGVRHTELRIQSDAYQEAVFISEIDLTDPFTEVYVRSAGGGLGRLETMRNLALECEDDDLQLIAAVNADFFSSRGFPSSLQISKGEIISTPATNKLALAIGENGEVNILHNIQTKAKVTVGDSLLSIDAVNRVRSNSTSDLLYLYTPRFGQTTQALKSGFEVVLRLADQNEKLRAGESLVAKVISVEEAGDTPISEGTVVLWGTGHKAQWLKDNLTVDATVEITVSFGEVINKAVEAVGGNAALSYPLLTDGELDPLILDLNDSRNHDRHPRTMVATKDGKLYLFVIDGRQPSYSDGMTLAEGAYFLQSLGMEQAINVDGGGSSTYLYRPFGESELKLGNRPSDGTERAIINGFVVVNTAPVGSVDRLKIVAPKDPLVLKGSTLSFLVQAVDENLNPVNISQADLIWEVSDELGYINHAGELVVTSGASEGELRVSLGDVSSTLKLTGTDTLAELHLDVDQVFIKTGTTALFTPRAKALDGREVLLSPEHLEWSVEGSIGTINNQGELTAADKNGNGSVIVRYGSLEASKMVYVMRRPLTTY